MIVFSAACVSVKVCGQVASTRMQTLDCLQCSEAGASQGGRNVHLYTGGNSWPVITSCIKKKPLTSLLFFRLNHGVRKYTRKIISHRVLDGSKFAATCPPLFILSGKSFFFFFLFVCSFLRCFNAMEFLVRNFYKNCSIIPSYLYQTKSIFI